MSDEPVTRTCPPWCLFTSPREEHICESDALEVEMENSPLMKSGMLGFLTVAAALPGDSPLIKLCEIGGSNADIYLTVSETAELIAVLQATLAQLGDAATTPAG